MVVRHDWPCKVFVLQRKRRFHFNRGMFDNRWMVDRFATTLEGLNVSPPSERDEYRVVEAECNSSDDFYKLRKGIMPGEE